MDIQNLAKLFKKKYNSSDWKNAISSIFPNRDFYLTPLEKKQEGLKKHENIDSILEFGDITLNDKSRILFYEVKLTKGKQDVKSRVSLRNLIHTDVIPGDVDGILATYYVPGAREWRLTFISKSLYWDEELNEIKSETHPKRYTYVLGETESTKTVVKQFQWLAGQIQNREITIQDLIKTFAVEKISKEFFDGYFHQFKAFEEYVTENPDAFQYFKEQVNIALTTDEQQKEAERLIRNFVKKLLGRIVFLYFLQKKGWLGVPHDKKWGDGERNFVGQLFESFADKINFYSACLAPLFFETLNRKRTDDIFAISGTKVPYLNGGLFDKDSVEPIEIKFNPTLFKNLFDFFDQYNFTVDENSPDDLDIGIDPEMLGLIFENLLEDNRDKGTFYTPKEVVHFMCKESLSLYIQEELKTRADSKEFKDIDTYIKKSGNFDFQTIQRFAPEIDQALNRVKICDPAIGSGAFPMGMVYEILRLKKELFGYLNRKHFDYRDEKLRIMKESIYGVDIDKGAVDISRLRFWLSLIVDEEEPSPLPNLDYKIMQGDSLKESFDGISLDTISWQAKVQVFAPKQMTLGDMFAPPQKEIEFTIDEKAQLNEWVRDYFSVEKYDDKVKVHAQIDKTIIGHIERSIELVKLSLERRIGELKANIKLTNKRLRLKDAITHYRNKKSFKTYLRQKSLLVKEENILDKRRTKLLELQNSIERPYFLWNLYFADVLQEGNKGFDIVIGNPPYGVKVDDEIKDFYQLGSKDSYGVFMSMAMRKLLKNNGVLSFIVSDTWLTIKSHYEIRGQVLNYQLKKIIRLHQDCFKATVNSCIFTLVKSPATEANEEMIAADLTNISTRKEVPEFRDKLIHLETYTGQYTPQYAVYKYPQNLLNTNSNKPIIFCNPKFFSFISNEKIFTLEGGFEFIEVSFNQNKFNSFLLADDYVKTKNKKSWKGKGISKIISGIKTGNNERYLRLYDVQISKSLTVIEKENVHFDYNELNVTDEIRKNGFPTTKDFYVPFEMGQPTEQENKILPCYYQPESGIAINWSEKAVSSMKNESHSDLANFEFRFNEIHSCISFSTTGIYAPTFRISNAPIFVNKSSRIIFSEIFSQQEFLGILNSKLFKYLFKNLINHSIESEIDDFKRLYIPVLHSKAIKDYTEEIIENQRFKTDYNYFLFEQKEIDRLVYELYGLNEEDINEVETWFARRYPKLANYAYFKSPEELQQKKLADDGTGLIRQLIAAGESRLVEFKSSMRYCLNQKSPQTYVEHSSFKNLAAFLNSDGGHLFIGVDDNGEIIGLEDTDFSTFKGSNKKDEFLKHFDNLTEKYFGNGLAGLLNVQFHEVDKKTIAVVEVKGKAPEPVILKNPEKSGKEEFFIRRNASAKDLTMYEFFTYAKEQWK
jgi:hypothetical protein